MDNKRGQGMSTNAIILIVLGVLVLVVLILGFTMGWGKVAPWLSSNNVDSVQNACTAACATQSTYDFCFAKRDLRAGNEKLKDITCNYLAKEKPKYDIANCTLIPCSNVIIKKEIMDVPSLKNSCAGNEGKTVQALIKSKLESIDCTP